MGLPEASVTDEQQAWSGGIGVADVRSNTVAVAGWAQSTHRLGLSFRQVCVGVSGRAELGLSLALLVCTAFVHFFSALPEETCLWAEQTLWGWGLAVF